MFESWTLALPPLLLGSDAPRLTTAAIGQGGGSSYPCWWLPLGGDFFKTCFLFKLLF